MRKLLLTLKWQHWPAWACAEVHNDLPKAQSFYATYNYTQLHGTTVDDAWSSENKLFHIQADGIGYSQFKANSTDTYL